MNNLTSKIVEKEITPMIANIKKINSIELWMDEDGDQMCEILYTHINGQNTHVLLWIEENGKINTDRGHGKWVTIGEI